MFHGNGSLSWFVVALTRYMGRVKFGDGIWVGIEVYGPPLEGNSNNGTLHGVK